MNVFSSASLLKGGIAMIDFFTVVQGPVPEPREPTMQRGGRPVLLDVCGAPIQTDNGPFTTREVGEIFDYALCLAAPHLEEKERRDLYNYLKVVWVDYRNLYAHYFAVERPTAN
jgi:hypothetical protein